MADFPERPEAPLRIAISDCLLGAAVRFDGGHKKSALPHAELAGLFEFSGFCPEVAIGMGTPRPPIRLIVSQGASDAQSTLNTGVHTGAQPRAKSNDGANDVTVPLQQYADRTAPQLEEFSGYIFMKNSPSCGLFRVKVFNLSGIPTPTGRGIYAQRISELRPALPLEECGRLFDPVLRENFVMRTFVYAHWQRLLAGGLSAAGLIEFHARYKYLLMAHSIEHYKQTGRLLSNLKSELLVIAADYFALLMAGLARPASRGGHANVLSHLQGYVKQALSSTDRKELALLIEDYRCGSLPLLAPLTLLRHHLKHHADDYALQQIYLEPHPGVPGLRRAL